MGYRSGSWKEGSTGLPFGFQKSSNDGTSTWNDDAASWAPIRNSNIFLGFGTAAGKSGSSSEFGGNSGQRAKDSSRMDGGDGVGQDGEASNSSTSGALQAMDHEVAEPDGSCSGADELYDAGNMNGFTGLATSGSDSGGIIEPGSSSERGSKAATETTGGYDAGSDEEAGNLPTLNGFVGWSISSSLQTTGGKTAALRASCVYSSRSCDSTFMAIFRCISDKMIAGEQLSAGENMIWADLTATLARVVDTQVCHQFKALCRQSLRSAAL